MAYDAAERLMAFTCEGCGRENLHNERGIYEGRPCFTWAGKMICSKCRLTGISEPTQSLKRFFDAAGVRLAYDKEGSIIVPV